MDNEIKEFGEVERVATGGVGVVASDAGDPVNLQMVMVTSSINHEYTRKAYEKAKSYDKKQQLLARMSDLKTLYFTARSKLSSANPDRLDVIEHELRLQKMTVLSEHGMH